MNILSFLYSVNPLILENFYIKRKLPLSHVQLNAHTSSCSTTFISFHSLNTPKHVMPGGEAPPWKRFLNTGRLKTNLTDGHKQSSEFVMATKIFCQGIKSNESVCRRYCLPHRDANSVALWKLMFYIYCSHPMEANQPQPQLRESKGCKMSHFLKMSLFLIPLQPHFGIFGPFLWVVWQARCCLAVMRQNCPKTGELRSHRAAVASLSAENKGPITFLLQKMTENTKNKLKKVERAEQSSKVSAS